MKEYSYQSVYHISTLDIVDLDIIIKTIGFKCINLWVVRRIYKSRVIPDHFCQYSYSFFSSFLFCKIFSWTTTTTKMASLRSPLYLIILFACAVAISSSLSLARSHEQFRTSISFLDLAYRSLDLENFNYHCLIPSNELVQKQRRRRDEKRWA